MRVPDSKLAQAQKKIHKFSQQDTTSPPVNEEPNHYSEAALRKPLLEKSPLRMLRLYKFATSVLKADTLKHARKS